MKVLSLLRLMHKRLVTKSPAYFQGITITTTVLAVIIGLPEFLGMFSIEVPKLLEPYLSKAISCAAFGMAFISALTVEDPTKLPK